jgi:SP family general alpha glucoside:H+ symporter-like MFS transporter
MARQVKALTYVCQVISTTVVMEGYDVTLLSSFIGYPAFRNKYGSYLNEESGYQISASWQTGLNDIAAVGNIIGALLNGYLTTKFGHRKVLMGCLVALSAMIFIVFFAPNIEVLLVSGELPPPRFICHFLIAS